MKCLRCEDQELEIQSRGDGMDTFEVDVCNGCGGIWLDAKELKRLDDNFFINVEDIAFAETAPTAEDAQLACPRCEGGPALKKVHPADHPDVVLDTCPTCRGFWLDKGELEKLRKRPQLEKESAMAAALRAEGRKGSLGPLDIVADGLLAVLLSL